RVFRSHDQVAADGHLKAPGQGVAFDRGNQRLGAAVLTNPGKATAFHDRQFAGDEGFQVHAGAEGATGASQNGDAQVRVAFELIDRGGNAVGESLVGGILGGGAVQGNGEDAIGNFGQDGLFRHACSPC